MNTAEQAYALAAIEFARQRPQTQEDCCALAARVSVGVLGSPQSDKQFTERAFGVAKGLFGPAFESVDDGQRWTWIDMCERALRDASAKR